jgi:hypothetical protein
MKMGVRWSDEKKNLSGDLDQHPRGVFFVAGFFFVYLPQKLWTREFSLSPRKWRSYYSLW